MTNVSKGFDRVALTGRAVVAGDTVGKPPFIGKLRLEVQDARVAKVKADAAPPAAMIAAPVAPARGPQQLVPSFTVTTGGMRRVEGAHWRGLSPLASAVAQAWLRHEARGVDAPFVAPFGPGQVTMAEDYAALVEWREGSAVKCASLEGGRGGGGGGSGIYIDTFVDQGKWLAELQRRIGDGVAMSPRRHMDRGNGRRSITVRMAVDLLCLQAMPVKAILRRFGWAADMKDQRALRAAICGALDRMQGYRDDGSAK